MKNSNDTDITDAKRRYAYKFLQENGTKYGHNIIRQELLDDEKFILGCIERNLDSIYTYATPRIRSRKDIALSLVKHHYPNYFNLRKELKANKDIIISVLSSDDDMFLRIIDNIPKKLSNDKDIAELAIKNDAIFEFLGDSIKNDEEFIDKYLSYSRNITNFKIIGSGLRSNKDFVIRMIKKYPKFLTYIIPYISITLRYDEDVALLTVSSCSTSPLYIKLLPEEYQQNDKVVLQAVRTCPDALDYVDKSYRERKEYVLVVLATRPHVYGGLSNELKDDEEIINYLINNCPNFCETSSIFQFHYNKYVHKLLTTETRKEIDKIKEVVLDLKIELDQMKRQTDEKENIDWCNVKCK